MRRALLAIWQRYLDRITDPATRPPGARLVHLRALGFPRADGLGRGRPPRGTRRRSDRDEDGTMRELLRTANLRLLLVGQTLSMFGDTAMLLVLGHVGQAAHRLELRGRHACSPR